MAEPAPLWTPPRELVEQAEMTKLLLALRAEDYNALWRWSVGNVEVFWPMETNPTMTSNKPAGRERGKTSRRWPGLGGVPIRDRHHHA